jgi:Tat protein translocase TatB subunit
VGSIGLPEILVVLVVALVVLGPKRLPDAARQMGKAVAEFRRMSAGLQAEVRDVFDDPLPVAPPPPPPDEPEQ